MNQLQVINQNGQLLVDSREVAEMVGKNHADLMRDIRGYAETLGKSNFALADFFVKAIYKDAQGKARPHFYLTRKGCDMVANKMTGEKGVLFTAAYVTKFEEMEKQQAVSMEGLSPILQFMIQAEMKQKQLEQQITTVENAVVNIKETFLQHDDDWRESLRRMFNQAVIYSPQKDYRALRNESYELLESRGRCDLDARLRNLKARLQDQGATKTQIEKTSKLDVIEADPRLKEIYTTIVKEISIRYVPVGV